MKLEFNKKGRKHVEATGEGEAIKKDKRSELSLPDLGKLEALATAPLTDKFALFSLGDKEDQLSNAYSVAISVVKMLNSFDLKMPLLGPLNL